MEPIATSLGATSNIAPVIIQSRAKVTSRSNIADDNPSFVTLSHMKRNSSIPFIPSSDQSCPNFQFSL
jgi:hypothetical protein